MKWQTISPIGDKKNGEKLTNGKKLIITMYAI